MLVQLVRWYNYFVLIIMSATIMSHDANTNTNVSFLQKVIVVLGGVVAPFFVVYTLITPTVATKTPVAVIDVAKNIKPLAVVEVAPDRSNYVEMSGEEVFNQACAACHGTGLMSSPKIGDSAAWEARIALGFEVLAKNAIEGVRTMPSRGGNPDLTDNEVTKAVAYMANQSGASFTLP